MSQKKKFDYTIVGQGLAGSLLAYFLLKKGQRVMIIDDNHVGSSSKIAAGIINPITGRRFVKSWMFDELRAFNERFYTEIEAEFGISLFTKRHVWRFLQKIKDVNEWQTRSAFEGYENYMNKVADWDHLKGKIHEPLSIGAILHAAQMDMPLLLKTFKSKFESEGAYLTINFDYEQLIIDDKSVALDEFEIEKIIFCEGQRGQLNPFFNYLPFETSKGEILIARIPGLKTKQILKDKLIVAPLGNDLYWCGSNYEWNTHDDSPTKSIRVDLKNKLKQMLKVDFEIIHHLAAIRPTVKDRRPFLGLHPKYSQLAIFNGLGTKGASLGPYWANHFADFLVDGLPLRNEVNILRFDFPSFDEKS